MAGDRAMDDALRQYMVNIEATQRRDHADRDLISQCMPITMPMLNHGTDEPDSKLADRTLAAEARQHSTNPTLPEAERLPSPIAPAGLFPRMSSPPPTEALSHLTLRQQLADAQKARSTLESQNAQIPSLETTKQAQARQIISQEREITLLKRKLKDREEEVREKQKLATQWQDEMITLDLEKNMAEQKAEKMEGDNRVLVESWMREMEGRAEKMNKDGGW